MALKENWRTGIAQQEHNILRDDDDGRFSEKMGDSEEIVDLKIWWIQRRWGITYNGGFREEGGFRGALTSYGEERYLIMLYKHVIGVGGPKMWFWLSIPIELSFTTFAV